MLLNTGATFEMAICSVFQIDNTLSIIGIDFQICKFSFWK
jgi:hypothetical protein